MKAPARLCLTADKTTVVIETDTRAAFLLCGAGKPVPAAFADQVAALFGGGQGDLTEPAADTPEPAEEPNGLTIDRPRSTKKKA